MAQLRGVKRLVFAHIGRPTIAAIDAGHRAPLGELEKDGDVYFASRGQTIRRRTLQNPFGSSHVVGVSFKDGTCGLSL
jgi:hypothetical protein